MKDTSGESFPNEYRLVEATIRAIRERYPNAWVLKTMSDGHQRRGVPDLLVVLSGNLVAIEMKHRKPHESIDHMLSRVSLHQRKELTDLRTAGARAHVCWTVEGALAALEAVHLQRLGQLVDVPRERAPLDPRDFAGLPLAD